MLQNKLHVFAALFTMGKLYSGMGKILKVCHLNLFDWILANFFGLKCFSKLQLNLQNKVFPMFLFVSLYIAL